jgi:hypothetical protein
LDVDITIPAEESHKILSLLTVLGHEFADVKQGLLQVAHEAREGVTINIKPVVHPHTQRQRNYYWKWCREFGQYCGTTPDETHEEILCHTYGTEYTETRFGIKRRPQKRSSEANRVEYSLLIDTLIRVAAEMGFDVPPPLRAVSNE